MRSDLNPAGALSNDNPAAGNQAQFNAYLQLFKRLVLASESLDTVNALYNKLPWTAAGDLDLAVTFPNSARGTVIIDQAVAAALNVTLSGGGPWTVVDGAGAAAVNNITVKGPGATTINGAATYVINSNWGSATFLLNGSNWLVLSKA